MPKRSIVILKAFSLSEQSFKTKQNKIEKTFLIEKAFSLSLKRERKKKCCLHLLAHLWHNIVSPRVRHQAGLFAKQQGYWGKQKSTWSLQYPQRAYSLMVKKRQSQKHGVTVMKGNVLSGSSYMWNDTFCFTNCSEGKTRSFKQKSFVNCRCVL